jgi:hypothetical protein
MSATNWQKIARARWKKADWIEGDGEWATVAACRNLTITLHKTSAEAEKAKTFIDKIGCGGFCRRNHSVVHLKSS